MRRLIVVTDQGTATAFASLFDQVLEYPNEIKKDDVVLFEGGTDVNPEMYGQQKGLHTQHPDRDRDQREKLFFIKAQKAGAACLGICRGSQFLTVMCGGKLIQDVTGHCGSHSIFYSSEGIPDIRSLLVTSTHHQMCYPFDLPEKDYFILGWASERLSKYYLNGENKEEVEPPGEPEIIWYPKKRSLAIQGHPEYMGDNDPFPVYCRNLVKTYIFGDK